MNKCKSDIDGSRLQEEASDTVTDPITPDCEEGASEHQIDFVMKMPNCVVDPESSSSGIFSNKREALTAGKRSATFLRQRNALLTKTGIRTSPIGLVR